MRNAAHVKAIAAGYLRAIPTNPPPRPGATMRKVTCRINKRINVHPTSSL
jgi:hypothetical protein